MEDLINQKREEMHKIMNSKDVKYEEILNISEELDELIVEYYKMKSDENDTKNVNNYLPFIAKVLDL